MHSRMSPCGSGVDVARNEDALALIGLRVDDAVVVMGNLSIDDC